MTQLTRDLNRLSVALENQNLPCFSMLQPGFTLDEIYSKIESFDFNIPLEFYELYQWRNGVQYGDEDFCPIFLGYSFHSLEYAMDLYEDFLEQANRKHFSLDYEIWNPKWFPVFSCSEGGSLWSGEYLCTIGNDTDRDTSPLLSVCAEAAEVSVICPSSGNLISIVADCYESGICCLHENCNISIETSRFNEIYGSTGLQL
ncbi:MAG: SMI1/KNR4 family protein [Cyanobacteriota bacterium]|nr:SMI1/KNR4 family protein [Cyanobacteriota bacterium]